MKEVNQLWFHSVIKESLTWCSGKSLWQEMIYRYVSFILKTIRWWSMRWTEINGFTFNISLPCAHKFSNRLIPIQSGHMSHDSEQIWMCPLIPTVYPFIHPSSWPANLLGILPEGSQCAKHCASAEGTNHPEASSCLWDLRKHEGLKITQENVNW